MTLGFRPVIFQGERGVNKNTPCLQQIPKSLIVLHLDFPSELFTLLEEIQQNQPFRKNFNTSFFSSAFLSPDSTRKTPLISPYRDYLPHLQVSFKITQISIFLADRHIRHITSPRCNTMFSLTDWFIIDRIQRWLDEGQFFINFTSAAIFPKWSKLVVHCWLLVVGFGLQRSR